MKFALRKGWAILLFVLPFCVSCGDVDLLDTNKWSDEIGNWTPSIKGAIASGGFAFWDFLQDSTREFRIEVGKDSNLIAKYTKKDIDSIDIAKVFKLERTPINFQANLGATKSVVREFLSSENGQLISFPIDQDLPLPDDFTDLDLHYMTLSKVTCSCQLSGLNGLKYRKIVILSKSGEEVESNNKAIWDTLMTVKTDEATERLENKTFDILSCKIYLKVDVYLDEEEAIPENSSVKVTLSDYDFSKVQGKIVKTIGLDGDFDMSMDLLNDLDIDNKILFTDPKVKLVMKNKGLGIPLEVGMTFTGTNKNGGVATLELKKPSKFDGNFSDTKVQLDTLLVNKDNSNIVEFLESLPQGKMNYSGKVTVNPEGKYDCVIHKDGFLGVDLNVEVPVALRIDSLLSYCDTVTNVNIDQKYADKIEKGTISLHVQENGLPLDLSIPKMVLLGDRNVPLDTIAVENEGIIKAGQEGILSFKVDEGVAKNLGKTRSILLEATVSGGTGEPVKANARLKFVLTLEATAVIKDLDDF